LARGEGGGGIWQGGRGERYPPLGGGGSGGRHLARGDGG